MQTTPDMAPATKRIGHRAICACRILIALLIGNPALVFAQSDNTPAPAASLLERLESTFASILSDPERRELAYGALAALLAIIVLFYVFRVTRRLLESAYRALDSWRGTRISALKIQSYEVLSADQITDLLKGSVKLLRIVALIIALYVTVPVVLSLFPWTRDWMAYLMPYLMAPVYQLFWGFVAFLPNLFSIIVIVVATRYLLRFVRTVSTEIKKGAIVFPGFHAEWADPTSKLVSFIIIVFAVVLISPYLPGFGSPAFQGISIFLGVLLSLGSTAAVANIVAGTALTYMRAFKVGDRVKIADATGDVIEKTLLVTRLRTIKNVEITIPNALVLASQITNFSAMAEDPGLILHTTVTIGYDAPWRLVHELLIGAGKATRFVVAEPLPFVLQTSLDDFSISYELNVYTQEPSRSLEILSELHQNIQDRFNEAGIEIMSPRFAALRDGNQPAMPAEHMPPEAASKGFRILPIK
ncbi:MAG: mechanosensitive ion channel family protein [Alphaproteobacteria bacterium]